MLKIPIWTGTSSFAPGKTPFGFYDNDIAFQTDADRVAKFCAQRLGFPIQEVELQDIQFYTAFEEAVTTYGNEVYSYLVKENLVDLIGTDKNQYPEFSLNQSVVYPNLKQIIEISQQYAAEAGVGGNVDWESGHVFLTSSIQNYDLEQWARDNGLENNDIEIKRVFYEDQPASTKYYHGAPGHNVGSGFGGFIGSYGFGSYNMSYSFLAMPINFDIAAIQQLELAQKVRISQFSFELINNKLKIFPIPTAKDNGRRLWFQYIRKSARTSNSIQAGEDLVTNASNVPYLNPIYSNINSVGRQWIFEYALAIAKETLGHVRNKYSAIPIPGDNVTLNGADLVSSGREEKKNLREKLNLYLDATSREKQLERRKNESDHVYDTFSKIPMQIYIG